MDLIVTVVAKTRSLELVHQDQCLLDVPSVNTQPAAMSGVSTGNLRGDGAGAECHAMRLRVACPVGHYRFGFAQRRAGLASDRRYGVHQRQELRYVMAIGAGELDCQRHSMGIDRQMVFQAVFPAIRGAFSLRAKHGLKRNRR